MNKIKIFIMLTFLIEKVMDYRTRGVSKTIITIIIVAVLFGIGIGYYLYIPGEPQGEELTVLRIGYQPSWHHTSEFIIVDKGWLQKITKLKVEEKEFPTGPPEMEAFIAGELDIAYVGAAPPIPAIAKGMKAKIVAVVNTEGSSLVLRPDLEFVNARSLKGMRIGCYPPGSIQDTILRYWLKENGLQPGVDVEIIAMGPREQIEALRAGAIDGIFAPDPMPYVALVNGYGKIVMSSGEMWPHHPCCVLLMSEDLLMNHRELAKEVLALHILAQEYIKNQENKDEVIHIITNRLDIPSSVASFFPGTTKFETDPHNSRWLKGIDYMCQVHYELGYTKTPEGQLIRLTHNDIVDMSLYDEALNLLPQLKDYLWHD